MPTFLRLLSYLRPYKLTLLLGFGGSGGLRQESEQVAANGLSAAETKKRRGMSKETANIMSTTKGGFL